MELTSAQRKIYDRQLRVWGVQAQQRINAARVLVIGMRGLSAELTKNLVLAGVGHVHVYDPEPVTQSDVESDGNFFLTASDVGGSLNVMSLTFLCHLSHTIRIHFLARVCVCVCLFSSRIPHIHSTKQY